MATLGDEILMPVADASGCATPDAKGEGPRASTRARVRLPITLGDVKFGTRIRGIWAEFRADRRRWWLLTKRPLSLRAWLRLLKPAVERVPDRSGRLRALWVADNHSVGFLFAGIAILLYLLAGAFWWMAGHPVRRWTFLALLAAAITYWLVA